MSGHTPGPWRVVAEDEFNLTVRADGHGVTASVFSGWAHEEGQAAQRANARLIAAAPELLAVCKSVVQMDHDFRNAPSYGDTQHYCVGCEEVDCDQDCPVRLAKMAVAKATGSEV